jgi:hypothetical protein
MVLKNPDLPATSGCRHLSAVEVIGTGLLAWCLQAADGREEIRELPSGRHLRGVG